MDMSTVSNVLFSNVIFKKYLMQLSTGIVWKNTTRAIENESTNLIDVYQAELYVTANRGLLNFDIIKSFPRVVLRNASIPDTMVDIYASDKSKIPVNLRNDIVAEYERALSSVNPMLGRPAYFNKITGAYETIYNEQNNYYRMLMGLPDKEDSEFIYNTDPRWSTTIPIHELSLVDRIEMERAGILDALIKKYPDKEYLNYLGKKYISPFIARITDRFEILYVNSTDSEVMNNDFTASYNSARRIILSIYYNASFRKINNLYDNFLAMCILFIAIQQMQYKYLQVDITRDFYDVESLKLVYDAYSVPFYSEVPLEYHRKIVKNVNKLISYKGSSHVFFDLFDIFDLRALDIYSYFLTKIHIVDDEGMPTFIIKKDEHGNDMYDAEGRPILDDSNYQIKFARVKIYDDPSLSVADNGNSVPYEVLTAEDPYWVEDPVLIKKLSDENFNFLESKYLGIQTVFDLMKITFENAYIFRLITDNKELTSKMMFKWSELGDSCSIFSLFIYLSAIYCRYYGYSGIITNHIPAVMDTIGLDFDKITEVLHDSTLPEVIRSNTELMNLLLDFEIVNMNSLTPVYDNIDRLRVLIVDGYMNAKTFADYYAYRDLYYTLLVSREITATYTNPLTGQIYESFTDILENETPILMQRFLLLPDENVENEILMVTDELESIINGLKYLPLSTGFDTGGLITPLFKILTFFKSAKAELVDYNITYTISMRGLNFFKLMDRLMSIVSEFKLNKEPNEFRDLILSVISIYDRQNDSAEMVDDVEDSVTSTTRSNDTIESLIDKLKSSISTFNLPLSYQYIIDIFNINNNTMRVNEASIVSDCLFEQAENGLRPVI